jgi:hypothetical protein
MTEDDSGDEDREDGPGGGDPFEDGQTDDPFGGVNGDDPFDDIDGIETENDPFDDIEPSENTLFTEVDVDEMDDEEVWARLDESDGENGETAPGASPETGTAAREPAVPTSGETVVDKRSFCERCEHFSEPPEVSCGYPDGEIVELVDTGRFRVRNCPIVEQRRSGDVTEIAGQGTTDVAVEDNETVGGDD